MNLTRWISPEASEPAAGRPGHEAAARANKGAPRIALLDNTKDNAHKLLQLIAERVREEFAADISFHRKGNATLAADADLLEQLARDADCVLTAMAD